MKPEYYPISDELRDRLADAVRPYMERATDKDMMLAYETLGKNASGIPRENPRAGQKEYLEMQEVVKRISYGVGEAVNNVLASGTEGEALCLKLHDTATGEGNLALVVQNLPKGGEGHFLMMAFQHLFGGGEMFTGSFGFGSPLLHRDHSGMAMAAMFYGQKTGADKTPTLFADAHEAIDVLAAIRQEQLRAQGKEEDRGEIREEIVRILELPAMKRRDRGASLLVHHALANGQRRDELWLDEMACAWDGDKDLSWVRFFDNSSPKNLSHAMNGLMDVLVSDCGRHAGFDGVAIEAGELLVFNNRFLVHACAAPQPIPGSERQMRYGYMYGEAGGPASALKNEKGDDKGPPAHFASGLTPDTLLGYAEYVGKKARNYREEKQEVGGMCQ